MSDNQVRIVEVGPRDGLQNEKTILSVADKADFIQGLIKAGLKEIEATSFVKKESIPQLGDAEELIAELKKRNVFDADKLLALVPNLKGLERANNVGVNRLAFFTATSETFNKKNINATIDESFQRMKEMTEWCKENGHRPRIRGYVSTVFGCPYEGKIPIKKIVNVTQRLLDIGVEEISFGDTIGMGTPAMVKEVLGALSSVISLEKMAMHFHDTRAMALTNIYVALELGVRSFDSSAAGLGGCPYAKGASGNVATEDVVYLMESQSMSTGIDLNHLIMNSQKILKKLGKESPSKFLKAKLLEVKS